MTKATTRALLAALLVLGCDSDGETPDEGNQTETSPEPGGSSPSTGGSDDPSAGPGETQAPSGGDPAPNPTDAATDSTSGGPLDPSEATTTSETTGATDDTDTNTDTTEADPYNEVHAEVTSVTTSGSPGAYSFSVGVFSPDTGCDQYANWWEVLSEDGDLLYRRILTHSHVPPQFKQPFVRTGGPVPIAETDTVIVRAHMNTVGFGARAFRGSVSDGFAAFDTGPEFATDLESVEPQPGECPF